MKKTFLLLVLTYCVSHGAFPQDILPPLAEWSGKSENLIVDKEHEWVTPAEYTDFNTTPDHATTLSWIMRLSDASDLISFRTIGISAQNRPIIMVIASNEKTFHEEDTNFGTKPNLLVQAGIHSGEIDGKDAGLMLLRDIAFGNKDFLLNDVNVLFIPILNVDGHEKASPYNRPNQRGPENMGWRTNARNLNLNRDFTKLETEGVQAVVQVMNRYKPVLYMDVHVTDGADYQYDITYGYRRKNGYSPHIAEWLCTKFQPEIDQALTQQGHIPGPLIFTYQSDDFSNGIIDYYLPLRFSDAYGDARHIPSILVENHSLKPYKQRVLGTYILLEQTIQTFSSHLSSLKKAIQQDQNQALTRIPLSFLFSKTQKDSIDLRIIESTEKFSDITKQAYVQWTGRKIEKKLPWIKMDEPYLFTKVPKAYWIPAEWSGILEKLSLHGFDIQMNTKENRLLLSQYFIEDYEINPVPSEGRFRFNKVKLKKIERTMILPPGSARIQTDQPLGMLLVLLLEPDAPDSFFQWGYFNSILSRTEYIESYVMEPLIQKMMSNDSELRDRFEKKKEKDHDFAKDPETIFSWFYSQSPYFDANWKVIPIGLEY